MKQLFLLLIITFYIGTVANAQKVAGYLCGEPGKDNYEGFSFWVKANKGQPFIITMVRTEKK